MIQGKQRLFAIVLFISLGFNLFLGGIVVGKYLGKISEPRFGHSAPMLAKISWIIPSLSKEGQEKVRPLMRKHREQMEHQMRRIKQTRHQVHQLLTAPDFNAEALSETLAKLRQTRSEARKNMHTFLVKMASQLSEKDRQRLSEATQKRRHSPPWRHKPPEEPDKP
jgi:uncharacterized membrane protein